MLMTSAWQAQAPIFCLPLHGLRILGLTMVSTWSLEKSQFVWGPGVGGDVARLATAPLDCSHVEGELHLGGFVVATEAKRNWVEDKVDSCVTRVS